MADNLILRFFIGTASGVRSGAWRVWANGSDVYVAAREVASKLKISLHASGQCNHAFTTTLADELGGEQNLPKAARRQDTWWCDRKSTANPSEALRLVFPASELRPLGESTVADRPFTTIAAPPEGHQVSVYFLFTGSGPIVEHAADLGVLADHPLPDGSRLIVVHRLDEVASQLKEAIRTRRESFGDIWMLSPEGTKIQRDDPGARIILPGRYGNEKFATFTEAALVGGAV